MDRSRNLLRDYGLTLGLALAAALIYWRATLPAMKRSVELDRARLEQLDEQRRMRAEIERLRALEDAIDDPLTIERVQRDQHGELGLPASERPLDPERQQ
jgi:hypothetical protein